MKGSVSAVAAGLALLQNAAAAGIMPRQSTCPTFFSIVARGSTEGQGVPGEAFAGQGAISAVTMQIQAAIPGSSSLGITYPATLSDYQQSEAAGVGNMTLEIEKFATACPNTPFAIIGFSQGGEIVADTLCGTSSEFFNVTAPIPVSYTKNLIAAVAFADPSHVASFYGNLGNATNDGGFVRRDLASCDPYRGRFVSYCQSGDLFCDKGNGSDAIVIHVREVQTYGNNAAEYIIGKFTALTAPGPVGGSNASTTVKPTATATSKPTTNVTAPTVTSSPPIFTGGASARAIGVQLVVGAAAFAGLALL